MKKLKEATNIMPSEAVYANIVENLDGKIFEVAYFDKDNSKIASVRPEARFMTKDQFASYVTEEKEVDKKAKAVNDKQRSAKSPQEGPHGRELLDQEEELAATEERDDADDWDFTKADYRLLGLDGVKTAEKPKGRQPKTPKEATNESNSSVASVTGTDPSKMVKASEAVRIFGEIVMGKEFSLDPDTQSSVIHKFAMAMNNAAAVKESVEDDLDVAQDVADEETVNVADIKEGMTLQDIQNNKAFKTPEAAGIDLNTVDNNSIVRIVDLRKGAVTGITETTFVRFEEDSHIVVAMDSRKVRLTNAVVNGVPERVRIVNDRIYYLQTA